MRHRKRDASLVLGSVLLKAVTRLENAVQKVSGITDDVLAMKCAQMVSASIQQ